MIIISDSLYVLNINPIKLKRNEGYEEYLSKTTFASRKSFLKSYFLIEDSLAQMAVDVLQDDAFLALWNLSDIDKLSEAHNTTCCVLYCPGITSADLLQQKIKQIESNMQDIKDKIIDIEKRFTDTCCALSSCTISNNGTDKQSNAH